jgi:hypothetical protein
LLSQYFTADFPSSVGTSKNTAVSFPQVKHHLRVSLAGIIAGVIGTAVLIMAFITLRWRRQKSRLTRKPRGHTPLIDIDNEIKPPAVLDECEADNSAEHISSVAELGRFPHISAPSRSEPTNAREALVNAHRVPLSHAELEEYHFQSSPEEYISVESGVQSAGQAEATHEQTDKHHSPALVGMDIVVEPVVLTAPDPLQVVVRAQQERMLEKAAARHDHHIAEGDATISATAPDSGSTPSASTVPEPEDYQALRAEVLLLRQRMQQMEESRGRGIAVDDDELPPAYEGRRSAS